MRTGWNSQEVPIFTRMLDKDSNWNKNNGLATLIPTLLHFSLIGYFICHQNSRNHQNELNY